MADPFTYEEATAPKLAGAFTYEEAAAAPVAPRSESLDDGHTTAPGLAASAARGAAPYATGIAVGAGIGSIVPGVGTALGAAAGGGAVLATDLASSAARALGITHMPTIQDGTDRIMDWMGVRRPTTGLERTAETTAAGVGGAASGVRAAGALAETLTSPVAKGVAGQLAERPVAQAVSGGLSGAAQQGAAEEGAGPEGQQLAGFLGSVAPFVKPGLGGMVRIDPKQAAKAAIDKGYVLPPVEAAEGKLAPYSVPSVLSAQSGKIKMGQYAATTNQPVTNRLAAEELGLPPDTMLTDTVFQQIRQQAGQAYDAIKTIPVMHNTPEYEAAADALGAQARAAAKAYEAAGHPNVIPTQQIDAVRAALLAQPSRATSDAIEFVKQMRFQAKANLASRDDPSKLAIGLAQRQAAAITEDMMEANLAAVGDEKLLAEYRAARTLIAKTYDVENVTNASTGDVSARGLARLYDKGKPLTGNLKIIADAANHFPRSFQNPAAFGGVEPLSVLDSLAAAAAVAHGSPGVAATVLGRPLARSTALSHKFQRAMVAPFTPPSVPLSVLNSLGGHPNAAQDLAVPQ